MAQTVDSILYAALSAVLPTWNSVKEDAGDGVVEECYYVFNYSTYGTGYADDDPTGDVYIVQVHLFAPIGQNISSLKKQTKLLLHEAGFTWPEITNATDEKGRHIVFECQYAEGLDL